MNAKQLINLQPHPQTLAQLCNIEILGKGQVKKTHASPSASFQAMIVSHSQPLIPAGEMLVMRDACVRGSLHETRH